MQATWVIAEDIDVVVALLLSLSGIVLAIYSIYLSKSHTAHKWVERLFLWMSALLFALGFALMIVFIWIHPFHGSKAVFSSDYVYPDGSRYDVLLAGNESSGAGMGESVAGGPGELISFKVNYHNAVLGTPAENAVVKVQYLGNEEGTLRIKASLYADNAEVVEDYVSVNVPGSGESLAFRRMAEWYPCRTTSDPEVATCGSYPEDGIVFITIGDVPYGADFMGYVVFRAEVVPAPQ